MLKGLRSNVCRALLAVAISLNATPNASAQVASDTQTATERASARAAMARGDSAFAAGRMSEAMESYRAADRLMRVPTTAFALGRAHLALGHLVEAQDAWLRAARYPQREAEPESFALARAAAAELAGDLEVRLPSVEVTIAPRAAVAELTVDQNVVALAGTIAVVRTDPGVHVLRVTAPGYESAVEKVTVREGERKSVSLMLARKLTVSDVPKATWVAVGMAGTALLTGIATGAASAAETSAVLSGCAGNVCDPAVKPRYERAFDLAHVSNVAFATAGAGLLAGLVSLSALPRVEDRKVSVDVTPGGLVLRGAF